MLNNQRVYPNISRDVETSTSLDAPKLPFTKGNAPYQSVGLAGGSAWHRCPSSSPHSLGKSGDFTLIN